METVLLRLAPHTAGQVSSLGWKRSYKFKFNMTTKPTIRKMSTTTKLIITNNLNQKLITEVFFKLRPNLFHHRLQYRNTLNTGAPELVAAPAIP